MKVILGPAVCKVCRALVFWATDNGRAAHVAGWRDENGRAHHCAKV